VSKTADREDKNAAPVVLAVDGGRFAGSLLVLRIAGAGRKPDACLAQKGLEEREALSPTIWFES